MNEVTKRVSIKQRGGEAKGGEWALQHFSIIVRGKEVEPARKPVGVATGLNQRMTNGIWWEAVFGGEMLQRNQGRED